MVQTEKVNGYIKNLNMNYKVQSALVLSVRCAPLGLHSR
jgi:hypothetical protein